MNGAWSQIAANHKSERDGNRPVNRVSGALLLLQSLQKILWNGTNRVWGEVYIRIGGSVVKLFSIKKLMSPSGSIQGKIFVAFSLVTLIGIVAVTSIVYLFMRETVKNNAFTSVTESIRQADESLNLRLEEIGRLNTVVATNNTVLATLQSDTEEPSFDWFQEQKRIEEFLSAVIAYKPHISRVAVIGLNGKVFYVGAPWLDKSVIQTPMMQYFLQNGSGQAYFHQPGVTPL